MKKGLFFVFLSGYLQVGLSDAVPHYPVCMMLSKQQNFGDTLLVVKMRNQCEAAFVKCNRGGELIDMSNCEKRRSLSADDITMKYSDRSQIVCARDIHQMHRRLKSHCYMKKLNCYNPEIQFQEVPFDNCSREKRQVLNKRQMLDTINEEDFKSKFKNIDRTIKDELRVGREYLPFLRSGNGRLN